MNKKMIKPISIAIILMLLGIISSCIAEQATQNEPRITSDGFDWQTSNPMEFLSLLKNKSHDPCPTYVIHGVTGDWVKEEHLAELISLLGSDQPCANVCRTISSFMDCSISTVGQEAAFIVEGFRRCEYPPDLNSGRARLDKDEIFTWWQDYQNKRGHETQNQANSVKGQK